MLMQDFPSGSPEHSSANAIFNAAMRGKDLVKQILAFSRQSEHKLIPVRPQQILKEVIKLTRSTIPTSIDVIANIQHDCGLVMADPTQLHQVAMNLITNAFHALEPTGGKLSVTLKETELSSDDLPGFALEPGKFAQLTVSDTGCGIDPSLMDKIFEPYFTTKEKDKGTGLGHAVVYGIVKEHRGEIKIYSELGKGTTIKVFLPLIKKFHGSFQSEIQQTIETGTERILLVDDETSIANVEKQMLERLGYQVTMRVNSVEALEAFGAKPNAFDLVISDITMPNMTGDQLARELIAINSLAN
jgi:nitrogen-specific signal transduction histidine kinase